MLKKFFANQSALFLITVLVCCTGLYKFTALPVALYPATSKPAIELDISLRFMGPLEFRERYGRRIESALKEIDRVEKVIADYSSRSIKMTVEFEWYTDSIAAIEKVRQAGSRFESELPREWPRFRYSFEGQYDTNFFMVIKSSKHSPEELEAFIQNHLVFDLQTVPGLAQVWSTYWTKKAISVELQLERLVANGLSVQDVEARLFQFEFDESLGSIYVDSQQLTYALRWNKRLKSLADIENILVSLREGRRIFLKDVAKVSLRTQKTEEEHYIDGAKVILLGGYVSPDANIQVTVDSFFKLANDRLQQTFSDVTTERLIDPSKFIREAVSNVVLAIIIGVLIASLVVLLFLQDVGKTIVICLTIPMSLLGGFILLDLSGMEVNLISLGGMALAVGMVVDGAIVVIENIERMVAEKQADVRLLDMIAQGVEQVKRPVLISLFTTIIVFAPLPFTSPLASAVLGDLAVVMVSVLSFSIIVTLFFVPGFYYFARGMDFKPRFIAFFPKWMDRLRGFYILRLEDLLISRPKKSFFLAIVAVMLVVALSLFAFFVRKEIIQRPETDILYMIVDHKQIGLESADKYPQLQRYEEKIRDLLGPDRIRYVYSQLRENQRSTIWVVVKDKSFMRQARRLIEKNFLNSPEANYYIFDWTPTRLRIPPPPAVKFNIQSTDELFAKDLLLKFSRLLDNPDVGRRRYNPRIDEETMVNFTLKPSFLDGWADAAWLRKMQQGLRIANYSEELFEVELDREAAQKAEVSQEIVATPLELSVPENWFTSIDDLMAFPVSIPTPQGAPPRTAPLGSIFTMESIKSIPGFYFENSLPIFGGEFFATRSFTGSPEELEERLKNNLREIAGPAADSLRFIPADTEVRENIHSLLVAIGFALVLITLLLLLQFGQLVIVGVIMSAIPLGLIGVGFSIWIFDSTLGINSLLGVLLLSGTAVNNSILLADVFLQKAAQGLSPHQAVIEAAGLRFRPILMTTITTMLGMMPIAFALGSGGEILQPLGIAVCGGLWVSTLLVLFVVPLLMIKTSGWIYANVSHD